MFIRLGFVSIFLFWQVAAQISSSRTELSDVNPRVENLDVFFACKRLFSREGQPTPVGCGSDNDNDGDFGRLIEIRGEADLSTLTDFDDNRAVLIPPGLLNNEELVNQLATEEKVKVLLIAGDTEEEFSGENVVNILFRQPVALLGSAETALIRQRIAENAERGFDDLIWNNGVILDFYNGQEDVTSEFCLDLGECDPLGGQSVWGTVGRSPSAVQTIVLAVKLDTNGLFHDLTFGARDTAGPLTVLLSIAQAFSQSLETIGGLETQIILAAFQGESFDGLGSKRFLFDIKRTCLIDAEETFDAEEDICLDERLLTFTEFNKLTLESFAAVVVLDNILRFDEDNPIFIHSANTGFGLTERLVSGISGSTEISKSITELPSSIIQNFVEIGDFNGEAIVITSYEEDVSEANSQIFSPGDTLLNASGINGEFIKDLAVNIGTAIVAQAAAGVDVTATTDTFADTLEATFAAEIAECLTLDFSCTLVQNTLGFTEGFIQNVFLQQLGTNRVSGRTAPTYFIGVLDRFEIRENKLVSGPEEFTRQFLASKISAIVPAAVPNVEQDLECGASGNCFDLVTEEDGALVLGDCQPERKTSVACVNRTCTCTSVFFHEAISPLIDRSGNIKTELQEEFPNERVFTEPRFALPTLLTFQHTNKFYEIFLFVLGLIVTISSYFLIDCTLKKLSNTKYKLL